MRFTTLSRLFAVLAVVALIVPGVLLAQNTTTGSDQWYGHGSVQRCDSECSSYTDKSWHRCLGHCDHEFQRCIQLPIAAACVLQNHGEAARFPNA